jgi:hypothetical protein
MLNIFFINKSKLKLWNLSNGKIVHEIECPNRNEIVEDCLCIENNLIVISNQRIDANKIIPSQFNLIKVYQLDLNKVKISYKIS